MVGLMVIFNGRLRKESPTKQIQEYLSSPKSFSILAAEWSLQSATKM